MADSNKSAYEQLVDEIKLSHPEPISSLEAHKIARKLMGFCQKLIEVNGKLENKGSNTSNIVDFQPVNGNVDKAK